MRTAPFLGVVLVLMLGSQMTPVSAAVTVLRHYKIGDTDSGAADGVVSTNFFDSASTNRLAVSGRPSYSSDVTPADLDTTLSLRFDGTNFATGNVLAALTDNFGVEAWVKTAVASGSHFAVYNGDTGMNGWGFFQNGNTWTALFGGIAFIPGATVLTNQWAHLALVRSSGTTTFYMNGVPMSSAPQAPNPATGSFAVGTAPQSPGADNWNGWIDDVRVFTFSPGVFTTADLLYYASPQVKIRGQGSNVVLSWPTNRQAQIERSIDLNSTNWTVLTNAAVVNNRYSLTNPASGEAAFYRLQPWRMCQIDLTNALLVTVGPRPDDQQMVVADINSNKSGGGPALLVNVDGNITNYFDATAAIAHLQCDAFHLPATVQWEIFFPPTLQGSAVAVRGITGTCKPVLQIEPNSLPQLEDTDAGADTYWRARLTLTTHYPDRPAQTVIGHFRFKYDPTEPSLDMFGTCQSGEPGCTFDVLRPAIPCNP